MSNEGNKSSISDPLSEFTTLSSLAGISQSSRKATFKSLGGGSLTQFYFPLVSSGNQGPVDIKANSEA